MAISMRHTKLKAEEAALLAGELKKPSWQSKNEGIHERVSFEDSIWGFDLAGGAFYKTPLRVTFVKKDSRAEKAGIRPGDKLLRINDIDTSTLTIQEAHEIIIESGIHLKIAVTAPEDEEDSYFCYQDPLQNMHDEEEERRLEEERARKRQVHAKVSSFWSLQWPWVSKRRIIYRESNCFMVPSKYEDKHREKFPTQPILRVEDDIVLHNKTSEVEYNKFLDDKSSLAKVDTENSVPNGGIDNKTKDNKPVDSNSANSPLSANGKVLPNIVEEEDKVATNGDVKETNLANGLEEESELGEEIEAEEEVEEEERDTTISKNESELDAEEVEKVETEKSTDDDVINEVMESHETMSKDDEERILDGILSSTDGHSPENSTSNER